MTDSGDIPLATEPDEPAPGELDGAGRRRNGREQSGVHAAKRVLRLAKDSRNVLYNGRTWLGRSNIERRDQYIVAAGGDDMLTPAIRECIHGMVKLRMLLDLADSFLAEMGTRIVNRRKKVLIPLVEQRQRLADSLLRHLDQYERSVAAKRDEGGNSIAEQFAKACHDAANLTRQEIMDEAYNEETERLRAVGRRRALHAHQRETATETPQEAPSAE